MKNHSNIPVANSSRKNDHFIRMVGAAQGTSTGLSRYARSLRQALEAAGNPVDVAGTPAPPVPGPLVGLAQRFGFDLRAFFTTYPLVLPAAPAHGVTHLTSQNQASAVAFRAPANLVVTVHDIITLAYRSDPELTGYMRAYDKFFDNLTIRGLRRATALIADSAHTRDDVVRVLGYPASRIHVVHLGVHHTIFRPRPVPADLYARYGLDDTIEPILYIGSEDPRKNLRRLIDAFASILDRFPQARLLKVGAARFAHEREQLHSYIRQRGLHNHVLFFDQVSDDDLVSFCNYARVFVFPSLYEGFGLPPLEAMACGTPVITSNASSLPEVVGDAAISVDPYDVDALAAAIGRVLGDAPLRAELRARGLARAAQFTWERAARETLAVYREVLGTRNHAKHSQHVPSDI
jgi:glycosyltransferase involved in cell wall biosynthesis